MGRMPGGVSTATQTFGGAKTFAHWSAMWLEFTGWPMAYMMQLWWLFWTLAANIGKFG